MTLGVVNIQSSLKPYLTYPALQCLVPDIVDASTDLTGLVDYLTQVVITCDVGYGIEGSATVTTHTLECWANKTFADPPMCLGKDHYWCL